MWKFIALLSLLIAYSEGYYYNIKNYSTYAFAFVILIFVFAGNSEGPDIVDGVEAKEDERPYQVTYILEYVNLFFRSFVLYW